MFMKNSHKPTIVFMGTPEFAVPSLEILVHHGFPVMTVVTAADKPAGRGQEIKSSPVKNFAVENNIPVLQPTNFKDKNFIEQLKSLNPDLFVVVAFRMLPKEVWEIPPMGTFNLHASLLPQYRGAAPINWAIINGEKRTGVTTFFIDEKIDTGKIISSISISIEPDDNAGLLHDKLKILGADLVLETVEKIAQGSCELKDQYQLVGDETELKKAPKIYKEDCRINWQLPVVDIHNFIRGLSPYPGAFTILESPQGKSWIIKTFRSEIIERDHRPENVQPLILTDYKNFLKVSLFDGILNILEIQQEGKKKMKIDEFLRGFKISESWRLK
jgi:methionyl-tRNA formyltransferase